MFFWDIILILSGLLLNVKYFAIRVEFQVIISPHTHSFLWVSQFMRIFHLKQTILCCLSLCKLIKFIYIVSRGKNAKRKVVVSATVMIFTSKTIISQLFKNVSEFELFSILKKSNSIFSKMFLKTLMNI